MTNTIVFPPQAEALRELAAAHAAFRIPRPAHEAYLQAPDPLVALLHQWGSTNMSPVAQTSRARMLAPPPPPAAPAIRPRIPWGGLVPVLTVVVLILHQRIMQQRTKRWISIHVSPRNRRSVPKANNSQFPWL